MATPEELAAAAALETPPATPPEPVPAPEVSNREVKDSPLFQKMAADLAASNKREADRVAAEQSAASEAERKKLVEEGRMEEALKLKDTQISDMQATHAKEMANLNIESLLYAAGFRNRNFLTGAKGGFDHETMDAKEYVAQCVADPENAVFLGSTPTPPPAPPGKPVVNGAGMTLDQMKLAQTSTDPAVIATVRQFKRNYFDKHGHMPPTS